MQHEMIIDGGRFCDYEGFVGEFNRAYLAVFGGPPWDGEDFNDLDDFLDQVDALIAHLRASRTRSETDKIMLPGEPERARRQTQLADGIELGAAVPDSLDELADELGVARLAVSR